MVDLSICISYFDAETYLAACLASIERNPPFCSYEILLVDDASSRPCKWMVEERFPSVRLMVNPTNLGFAASNNLAIRESKGRYVLLLNNDTEVLPGSLDALVSFAELHTNVAAVGPMLLNTDGSFQPQCKRGTLSPLSGVAYSLGFDRLFRGNHVLGEYLMTYADPRRTHDVKGLSGACMLVRREAIEQVGLLEERFRMYGEDIDWCYRMRARGWRVCYLPEAQVIHHGGKGGSVSLSYRNIYLYHRALWLLFTRYRQTRLFRLYGWLVWLALALRFVGCVVINSVRREKRVGTKKGQQLAARA